MQVCHLVVFIDFMLFVDYDRLLKKIAYAYSQNVTYTFQNEKRKMLMEHETLKLKQLEEEHSAELKEWKANLKPRKQVFNLKIILIS